jgi:4,5-dihydroxyphthalate decarboxylase
VKDVAMERYRTGMIVQNITVMVLWATRLLKENSGLFPEDWWPYGVKANRKTIDTFLRYHFEQGLSRQRLTCEDIFAPELLDT